MHKRSILRLGVGALLAYTASAGAACDPAFNLKSVVSALSPRGHIVAVHGNDGAIRVAEYNQSTGTYGGWIVVGPAADGYSDAWVQDSIPAVGNYVYAQRGDTIIQWKLAPTATGFNVTRSSYGIGANGITGRPASAYLSSAYPSVVAVAKSGVIKVRNSAGGTWNTVGTLNNAIGAPWMVKVGQYVNMYVRTGDQQIYQSYWTGSSWSAWVSPTASFPANDGAKVNSDPASSYDGTSHYLFYVNTNGRLVKGVYDRGWDFNTTFPEFQAKKSLSTHMAAGVPALYGADDNGNTFYSKDMKRVVLRFGEANCLTQIQ